MTTAIPIPDTTAADDDEIVEAMLVAANDACNDDDGDHAGAMRAALAAARPLIATAADYATQMRGAGWSVAVHNDYRLNGRAMTFWLWTHPDGQWIKGEGETDQDALVICVAAREALAAIDAAKAKGGG